VLPDFIEVKRRVSEKFVGDINPHEGSLPSQAKHTRLHEGNRATYCREDGEKIELSLETRQYVAEVDNDTVRGGGIRAVAEIVSRLRDRITEGMAQRMITDIVQVCEEVGNVIDAQKRPITPESILDVYEKIETGFDSNGEWIRPSVAAQPAIEAQIREQMEKVEREPELRRRLEKIIEAKRARWNDREANRKLVD
jgi:hypothetical protein